MGQLEFRLRARSGSRWGVAPTSRCARRRSPGDSLRRGARRRAHEEQQAIPGWNAFARWPHHGSAADLRVWYAAIRLGWGPARPVLPL